MTSLGWLTQPAVFPWAALALGLCVGSFLNVVIHRLPRMMEREWLTDVPAILEEAESLKGKTDAKRIAEEIRALTRDLTDKVYGLAVPRSSCPKCGHRITAVENVPVLSYVFLRGRCSSCRAVIRPRYPAVELLAGVAAWYSASRYGFGWQAFAAAVFVWATIALAFIDQDTGYLPDQITLPLLWVGLLVNLGGTFVPLKEAVVGAAAGYFSLWSVNAVFKLVRRVDGMGFGDFKMNAAVGAFLGWTMLPLVIILSSVLGAIFGVTQMLAVRRGWDGMFKFHFGPYIAIAGVVVMFWGREIAEQFPLFKIY
jgi:leader peptidase (prepilin peptidase)/N-methyltransferase